MLPLAPVPEAQLIFQRFIVWLRPVISRSQLTEGPTCVHRPRASMKGRECHHQLGLHQFWGREELLMLLPLSIFRNTEEWYSISHKEKLECWHFLKVKHCIRKIWWCTKPWIMSFPCFSLSVKVCLQKNGHSTSRELESPLLYLRIVFLKRLLRNCFCFTLAPSPLKEKDTKNNNGKEGGVRSLSLEWWKWLKVLQLPRW